MKLRYLTLSICMLAVMVNAFGQHCFGEELTALKKLKTIDDITGRITSHSFSQDGRQLVTTFLDVRIVYVFDARKGRDLTAR